MSATTSRRTFLKASLVATGLLLSACEPSAIAPAATAAGGTEVDALLYVGYPLDEARIEAFGLFKRIAPDLDIEAIEIDSAWDDMQVQVGAVLASGNRIDLLPSATHGLPRLWASSGQLLDLHPWLADALQPAAKGFPSALLQAYTWGQAQYGLPLEFVSHAVLLNRTVFADAGQPLPGATWTWQDCLELSYALTRRGGSDATWGWGTELDVAGAEHWLWANGGPGLFDRSAADFANPTASHQAHHAALEWLSQMWLVHKVAPGPEQLRSRSPASLKLSGNLAMWMASSLDVRLLEDQRDRVDWEAVPVPRAHADGPGATMVWSTGLAVASGTRFPDEAAQLLAHMTTGEGAARMARDSAHPVAGRPDLWLTDERRARGGSVFVDSPRTADRVGDNSLGSNHRELLETVVEPNWNAVFAGAVLPETALATMDDQLTASIRNARLPQV
ncbi:MAG: extracellular solute-binding protein [Caldilineaceae bacterium]|nr:extracellular solute-binding protein [Caldilineaceae bacterium]